MSSGNWLQYHLQHPNRGLILRSIAFGVGIESGTYLLAQSGLGIVWLLAGATVIGLAAIGIFWLGYFSCYVRLIEALHILGLQRRMHEAEDE